MTVVVMTAVDDTNARKDSPASHAVAVTPSDTTTYVPYTRGVYVGTGGNLAVILSGDTVAVTFLNVPSGTLLPLCCTQIMNTNTTASNVVALS